jgi:hypothetical protein
LGFSQPTISIAGFGGAISIAGGAGLARSRVGVISGRLDLDQPLMKEILHSLAHKLHINEFEVLNAFVKLKPGWSGG